MRLFIIRLLFSLLIFTNSAYAEIIEIDSVIEEVLQNSKIRKSAEYALDASQKELEKSQKHWLPQLYLDHSTYKTNDPTQKFMSNLYQRSISQSDFNPNAINKTSNINFSKSAIGLNLPLYQGGSSVANNEMSKNLALSNKYQLKQTEIEQYADIVAKYIMIVSLQEQKRKLENITSDIKQIISKYSLRNKKNQIGYSGFLILQSSLNKAESFLVDNVEKTKALYNVIEEMGFNANGDWNVKELPMQNYIDNYLDIDSDSSSYKTLSIKAEVEANQKREKVDNANNLPKLNLFAENYYFNGSRSMENGYVAGINLRWNFFDPFTYGNKSIAIDKYNSSHFHYLAEIEKENSEIKFLDAQIGSTINSIKLATESEKLMLENIGVSKNLFKNGSINASNLSDAFMNYLDNFVFLANMQIGLIELYSQKISKQKIDINEIFER